MSFNFIMTNDPDHGITKEYIPIFKELTNIGVKVSTAVFCKIEEFDEYPNEPKSLAKHCHKGETHSLENPAYKDLMLEIKDLGHEIAFHGYSQISNTREQFEMGLDIYKDVFGEYPFVYMEHGGNPKKHPVSMCKKETLDMYGKDKNSKYYIWDIIKEKIGCVWAHHQLIDDDNSFKKNHELFYEEDGVLMFRRYRMCKLESMIESNIGKFNKDNIFIGYTHFGYSGYLTWDSKSGKHFVSNADILENWWNPTLLRQSIKKMKNIINAYNPKIYTIREFVEEKL